MTSIFESSVFDTQDFDDTNDVSDSNETELLAVLPKRKRGRPRKDPSTLKKANSTTLKESEANAPTLKRKRGRPKKIQAVTKTEIKHCSVESDRSNCTNTFATSDNETSEFDADGMDATDDDDDPNFKVNNQSENG